MSFQVPNPHSSRPTYDTTQKNETRISMELQPAVRLFFEFEAKLLREHLAPLRAGNPAIGRWVDEVVSRVENPIVRVMRFRECDLPRLDAAIEHTKTSLHGLDLNSLRERVRSQGATADELSRIIPDLLADQQLELQNAERRLVEGRNTIMNVDVFLSHVCVGVNDLENSAPRRNRLEPGFFVSQEWHRLSISKRALPPDGASEERVTQLLGGDLVWLAQRLADQQRLKATVVRTHGGLRERENRELMREANVEVHFPAPLGVERMSGDKFVKTVLSGEISAAEVAVLAESIEMFFLKRAEKVLSVK